MHSINGVIKVIGKGFHPGGVKTKIPLLVAGEFLML
jgi:hypothetical protein